MLVLMLARLLVRRCQSQVLRCLTGPDDLRRPGQGWGLVWLQNMQVEALEYSSLDVNSVVGAAAGVVRAVVSAEQLEE